MNNEQTGESKASLGERVREELRHYLAISAYLFVAFWVFELYTASVLETKSIGYLHFGLVVGKALIIGKFILLGGAMNVGGRVNAHTLTKRIILKSLAFLLLLMVFSLLEEIIVGLVHGHALGATMAEFFGRPWLEIVAPALVMWFVLIPLIGMLELAEELGPEALKALFLSEKPASPPDA